MNEPLPLIAAHRGSSAVAPENTLTAFRQAIDDGADMIELDVRMTGDHQWVVHHDRTTHRTTRKRHNISDTPLFTLQALDAGTWFGPAFAGERIPSLAEVTDLLPSSMKLNIEVKTDGDKRKDTHVEEKLLLFLRERSFIRRALVSSFDHRFLRRLHEIGPEISIGALYSPVRDIARKPAAMTRKSGASTFICSISQLRPGIVEDTEAHGMALGCYGVNTRGQFDKAMKHGVDIIITDHPALIRQMLNAWLRR